MEAEPSLPELEYAPVLPAGRMYGFGDSTTERQYARHRSHRPLYAKGRIHRPGTTFIFFEWATIPNSLFKKNPPPLDFLVQIRRDGKMMRTREKTGWDEREGQFLSKDSAGNGIGYRYFKIRGQQIFANRLVAHAYFNAPPSKRCRFALHTDPVTPRSAQSDDNVTNVSWGTKKENDEDRSADGHASNREGRKFAIYGRPHTDASKKLGLPEGIDLDPDFDDGTWALFPSATDAEAIIDAQVKEARAFTTKKLTSIYHGDISKVCSGKQSSIGGWQWRWKTVPAPAQADLKFLDTSKLGDRYATRDGRLLYKKSTLDGDVYVQPTQTARPSGYVTTRVNNRANMEELRGNNVPFHRIVALLFNRTQLEAKIASSSLPMAQLDVDHIDGDTTNNAASNLLWLTRAEHNAKTHGRLIVETATEDHMSAQLATFATITAAAESANVINSTFWYKLKNGDGTAAIKYVDGSTRYFFRPKPDDEDAELADDDAEIETLDNDAHSDSDDAMSD